MSNLHRQSSSRIPSNDDIVVVVSDTDDVEAIIDEDDEESVSDEENATVSQSTSSSGNEVDVQRDNLLKAEPLRGSASLNGWDPCFVQWEEKAELHAAQYNKKLFKVEPREPKDLSEIPDYEKKIIKCTLAGYGFNEDLKYLDKRGKKEIRKLKVYLDGYLKKQAYLPKGKENLWRLSLSNNISNGLETNPVPVFCDLDTISTDVIFSRGFKYITQNKFKDEDALDKSENIIYKCDCAEECKPGSCKCIELQEFVNGDYDVKYLGDRRVMIDRPVKDVYTYMIVMCGDKCGCPKSCPNRLENLKPRNSFEIFRRNIEMGFGIRTLSSIKLGEIVFEFVGRVMKEKDLQLPPINGEVDYRRIDYAFEIFGPECHMLHGRMMTFTKKEISSRTWRKNLDTTHSLFIDPYTVGNVCRFLSCSCYPNLAPVRVVANYLHPMRHHIYMVAIAPIAAGTELSFDYGEAYKHRKGFTCLCGSPLCKDGPMNVCKSTIPMDEAVKEVLRLHRAWKKEAEEKDEDIFVIDVDEDEAFDWTKTPVPSMKREPTHLWAKGRILLENPVRDADWDPSKVEDRMRTPDEELLAGDKRQLEPDSDPEESYKRPRINISPERDNDPIWRAHLRRMHGEAEDDDYEED